MIDFTYSVIESLKSIIANSTKTKEQLQKVIPVLGSVIALMTKISVLWEGIHATLGDIKEAYQLW